MHHPYRHSLHAAGRFKSLSLLLSACTSAVLLVSCAKSPEDKPATPLGQGTLGVSPEGDWAVSAFSETSQVEVYDLNKGKLRHTVELDGDTRLGQVTVSQEAAFVTDRHNGVVLKVMLEEGDTQKSERFCREPRGSALSKDEKSLYVACADGQLVTLDAVSLKRQRKVRVAPDLRDVGVLDGGGLVVSTFRKAEVITLDSEGQIAERFRPEPREDLGQPGVAWRMHTEGDEVYVLYQFMSDAPLGGGLGGYYGNGCSFQVVRPALAHLTPNEEGVLEQDGRVTLNGAAGALDFSVKDGQVAIAVPGNAWSPSQRPSLIVWEEGVPPGESEDISACSSSGRSFSFDGEDEEESTDREAPMAVAMSARGQLVTQSSEGGLRLGLKQDWVKGARPAVRDRGQRMFHMSTDLGIACVSCHPDGGDDGHTWKFSSFGLRRSQNLRGGLSDRKVFHWSGDLSTIDDLMDEVFVGRMGLSRAPSEEQQEQMVRYLDRLPQEASASDLDEEAVARGADLFDAVGCADCHNGPRYTDGEIYDVGTGGPFVTPSLLGVAVRAPYLHDGCAETLHDRFGACGGGDKHGKTAQLKDGQVDDLVAFLESL